MPLSTSHHCNSPTHRSLRLTSNLFQPLKVTHGFLYLATASTPFTPSLLASTFALSKSLFSLPANTKNNYWIDTNNRGYTGIGNEILDPDNQKTGDKKEAWNFGEFNEHQKLQQGLPDITVADTDGESVLREFDEACRECCTRVLELLALGLEIEGSDAYTDAKEGRKWFSTRHGRPSGSIVRLLKYPPSTATQNGNSDIGAGAHSDYGSITLLFQRPGGSGLEIRDESQNWKGVAVIPPGYDLETNDNMPPIVVNVGDLLEYWTNGLLKSTVHRVVMPEGAKEDRYSVVYFCHPTDDEGLVAVPSRVVQERAKAMQEEGVVGYGGGAGGKALTAKEHLMRRLEATYGTRKEE